MDVTLHKDSFEKIAGDLDKLFPERLTHRGHRLISHHQTGGSGDTATTPEADSDAAKSKFEHEDGALGSREDLTDTAHLLGG